MQHGDFIRKCFHYIFTVKQNEGVGNVKTGSVCLRERALIRPQEIYTSALHLYVHKLYRANNRLERDLSVLA